MKRCADFRLSRALTGLLSGSFHSMVHFSKRLLSQGYKALRSGASDVRACVSLKSTSGHTLALNPRRDLELRGNTGCLLSTLDLCTRVRCTHGIKSHFREGKAVCIFFLSSFDRPGLIFGDDETALSKLLLFQGWLHTERKSLQRSSTRDILHIYKYPIRSTSYIITVGV